MKRLLDQNPQRELRRQNRILLILERQFTKRFAQEILAETGRILTHYELTNEYTPSPVKHLEALTALEEQLAEVSMRAFGTRVIEQGKSSGLLLEVKFDVVSFFREKAIAFASQEAIRRRITSIAETTRSLIIAAITKGLEGGASKRELIKTIMRSSPSIARLRAKVIARTETHAAANAGASEAANETGLRLKKEWIAVNDGRTRSSHSAANGQIVGRGEQFIVNGEALAFPGDPNGSAANVINCRCALGHVLGE